MLPLTFPTPPSLCISKGYRRSMRSADLPIPIAQQAGDSSNAAQRNARVNGGSAAAAPAHHQMPGQHGGQSPAARPRPWPRYRLNGGTPVDPFPAGPVLPPGQPGR